MIFYGRLKMLVTTLKHIVDRVDPLPERKTGRPRVDRRTQIRGILHMAIHGCTWRELPRKYGSKSTVHASFLRWASMGVFETLKKELLILGFSLKYLDLRFLLLDSSDRANQNLPKKEVGFGYKLKSKRALRIQLITDAQGTPLDFSLMPASLSDHQVFHKYDPTKGINDILPDKINVFSDKGYHGKSIEEKAKKSGLILSSPHKKSCTSKCQCLTTPQLPGDRVSVEHAFGRLYDFKRIRYCLDRSKTAFAGWMFLAFALIYISV